MVSSRPRRVLCRIPNATVQSKCWAARSIMLDGANPGLALRCGGISGIINPVPQIFLGEVCVSHALIGRQSQPDRTHSAPTYWLQEGFEARRQSACYHTSAGSSACRRKTGQGTDLGERFHGAKSGSHSTLRWREQDSNNETSALTPFREPPLRNPIRIATPASISEPHLPSRTLGDESRADRDPNPEANLQNSSIP